MRTDAEDADQSRTKGVYRFHSDVPGADDLYFIWSPDGYCKIGRSKDCKGRLAMHQVSNPAGLVLYLVIPGHGWQETVWHLAFRHCLARGEWFHESPDLLAAILAARDGEEWIATLTSPREPHGVDRDTLDHRWRDYIADLEELAFEKAMAKFETKKGLPCANTTSPDHTALEMRHG